jgi:hypothetical protein
VAIVSALEAEGIPAKAVGGYTAGFRAEAPGWVTIVVAEADLPRGRAVLADLRSKGAGIDWSKVDVGDADSSEAEPKT